MSIDSKSANLLSSDDACERAIQPSSTDMEMLAQITATFTRLAFFLSILAFCVLCGYEYAATLLYGKGSLPPGVVGLLVVVLAMMEMTLADYSNRLPFYYAGKAATLPYGFFTIGGFWTAVSLLLHEQIAGVAALHVMAFLAVATTVLGTTIVWRSMNVAGEKMLDTMEKSW